MAFVTIEILWKVEMLKRRIGTGVSKILPPYVLGKDVKIVGTVSLIPSNGKYPDGRV